MTSSITNSKVVQFSTVEIREYDSKLSFNPSCSRGPALELGWRYNQSDSMPIDDYEASNPSGYRRTSKQLIISPEQREIILKEVGYSRQQIEDCINEILMSKLKSRSPRKVVAKSFSRMIQTIPIPIDRRPIRNGAA